MGGGGDKAEYDGAKMNIMKSSTFGSQMSSRRRSAPSFGFGAATREVANKIFISQEHTALATAGMHSPGPATILLPNSIGGKQPDGRRLDPPSYGFGSGARFMTERKETRTPGPGAYGALGSSMGPQVWGRHRTQPIAGFGTAERKHMRKVFISKDHQKTDLYGLDSPGPATIQLPGTTGRQVETKMRTNPSWVFSSAGRDDPLTKAQLKEGTNTPGPANYSHVASVGRQIDSKMVQAPMAGFGTSEVSHQYKLFLSTEHEKMHFGKTGPGPAANYTMGASVGPQQQSKDSSQPRWGFSQADRWHTYNKELKANTTPGPGAYDP